MALGFGVFIVAVGVLAFLTSQSLDESRELGHQIEDVLVPSLESLESLNQDIAETRIHIKHWQTKQTRDDDPDKARLRKLMNKEIPSRFATLRGQSERWSTGAQQQLDSLEIEVDQLFIVYGLIMGQLDNFASYDDPFAVIEAEAYTEGRNAPLPRFTALVQNRLDGLTRLHSEALRQNTNQMEVLGDRLTHYAGRMAWGVLFLGVALAVMVTRSIVKPIRELKRALLYMGRGVLREEKIRVTPDEVGDMAMAVNRLSEGLSRTQKFSLEVGSGQFNTPYEPLSEDDELGKALLQMRSSLEANERELEGKVEERTEELERQKTRAESVLRDLQDSIVYAKRIQDAIIPSEQERREVLQDSAVFFAPRDEVSGDFYWFKAVGSRRMFAAIDCTGHGVPGAFLSLIGHNSLERVTKVYTEPHKVLDNLNAHVLEWIRKDIRDVAKVPKGLIKDVPVEVESSPMEIQDGMDMAMVALNWETMSLEYAGANNPLYVVRHGELIEMKADKRAICSFEPGAHAYTLHTLELQSGDNVFLATDGFVDQFGGPHGKKFMRRRFRELLVETASLPSSQQERHLERTFNVWKGDEAQVDDVLVVSVKVP
jgi:serine phosphatase RsbU (regulator of sigma subunit)/HAMP domain-containing protein